MNFVTIEPGEIHIGDVQPFYKGFDSGITKPFKISSMLITQYDWFEIMKTRPWEHNKIVKNPGLRTGDNFPAVGVTWFDANLFVHALSSKLKAEVNLPTEVQWEYAIRAGSNTEFFWGQKSDIGSKYGWARCVGAKESDLFLHEVGRLAPNRWGLYDMAGNVCEWVRDKCEIRKDSPLISKTHYPKKKTLDFFHEKGSFGILKNASFSCPNACMGSSYKRVRQLGEVSVTHGFRVVIEDRS